MTKKLDPHETAEAEGPAPMPLKLLGNLEPDEKLLLRSISPRFEPRDFTQSGELPPKLLRLLKSKGLEVDEDLGVKRGMLFGSNTGVNMHQDEKPSVLWVLNAGGYEGPQLICAGEHRDLVAGEVLFFDARQPHGVIVSEVRYWVVLSAYVRPLKDWETFLKSN